MDGESGYEVEAKFGEYKELGKYANFSYFREYIIKNNVPAIFPEVGFPSIEIDALQAEVKRMGYDVKIAEPLYSYYLGGEGSDDYLYLNAGRTQMDRIYYGLKSSDDPDMPAH